MAANTVEVPISVKFQNPHVPIYRARAKVDLPIGVREYESKGSFDVIEGSTPREAASRGVELSIAPKDVAVFAALAKTPFGMRCGGRPDKVKKYNKKK